MFYILHPEPIKRKPPLMFTPTEIKTTKYSDAELDQFWNRILFSEHSDTTLQILGKLLCHSFVSSKTPDYSDAHIFETNPYNTLRIGLHDKLLNFNPLFTLPCFVDTFITLFGYPCYNLTQCGKLFSFHTSTFTTYHQHLQTNFHPI